MTRHGIENQAYAVCSSSKLDMGNQAVGSGATAKISPSLCRHFMTRFGCGLAGICRPVLTLRYAAGRKVSSFVHPRSPRQCSRITESIFVYSTSVLLSTSVSKSCYYHIRQLRCIRPHLDSKTASTIATFIVHSKPDMKE